MKIQKIRILIIWLGITFLIPLIFCFSIRLHSYYWSTKEIVQKQKEILKNFDKSLMDAYEKIKTDASVNIQNTQEDVEITKVVKEWSIAETKQKDDRIKLIYISIFIAVYLSTSTCVWYLSKNN